MNINKYNLAEASNELGLHRSYVPHIMNGTKPGEKHLDRLAKWFGVSTATLRRTIAERHREYLVRKEQKQPRAHYDARRAGRSPQRTHVSRKAASPGRETAAPLGNEAKTKI